VEKSNKNSEQFGDIKTIIEKITYMKSKIHIPVMPREVLKFLLINEDGVYVDATAGTGGHTLTLLSKLKNGKIIALEKDAEMVKIFKENVNDARVFIVHTSYLNLHDILKELRIEKVDGILFDLGISSPHVDNPERGFSYDKEGPLDMRFDQHGTFITAYDIVNGSSFAELVKILKEGGVNIPTRIARAIVKAREIAPIKTTTELAKIVKRAFARTFKNKKFRKNVVAPVFQAIRIAVNNEFSELREGLKRAISSLRVGGRIAIITFHSAEDKIVKDTLKEFARGCVCPPKQPICTCNRKKTVKFIAKLKPTEEEIEINPRARSATLRIAEKIAEE